MGGGRGAATKVLWNIVVLEKRCPELRQLGDKFLSTLLTSVSFNPQIRNIESIGLKCRALEYAFVFSSLYLRTIMLRPIRELLCFRNGRALLF
jgi:hypothetical protein